MLFKEIQGLEQLKTSLIDGVKHDHVAHAQLFLGRMGSANLAIALAYATYLNCTNRGEEDACGTCPACTKMNKYIHPDFHFVFPLSGSQGAGKGGGCNAFLKEWRKFISDNPFGDINEWSACVGIENKQLNISREESRSIIRSLALTAFEGNYKVMLIWLPEYMHPGAANAILKILEEPPEKTVFLLVSNDVESLLTTILSRTQIINVPSFSDHDLSEILIGKYQVEERKAQQIVHLSDGNLNRAIELTGDMEDDSHEMFREWMRLCYMKDFSSLVEWCDKFQKLSKESQKSLFEYGLHMMRETIISNENVDTIVRLVGEELDFIQNFSKVLSFDKVNHIVEELNNGIRHLERNANPKITFLDLSLTFSKVLRAST